MSVEDNKALVGQYIEEVTNRQRLDRVGDFVAADFVNHVPGSETPLIGPDSVKQGIAAMVAVLPDCRAVIETMTAEDDRVVIQVRFEGTSQGRRVSLPGTLTYRVQNGKLAERWGQINFSALSGLSNASLSPQGAQISQGEKLLPSPRRLTPKMRQYAASSGMISPIILAVIVGLLVAMDLFLRTRSSLKAALFIWCATGLSIVPLAGILIAQVIRRRNLTFVLENGETEQATVRSNGLNWGMKLNGAPLRVVEMEVAGRPVTLKTFDHNLANSLPAGTVVEVLCHSRYPKVVVPVSCLV